MYTYDRKLVEKEIPATVDLRLRETTHAGERRAVRRGYFGTRPELVGEVPPMIRQIGREHDLTMLMVTHQMGFAKEFSDRVSFFCQGRIAEQGQPNELSGTPKNERARQFLHAVLEAG
jgi:hypothetical protein